MVAYNENAEADQVMYTMAKRYESQGYKVVVYSGDNDFSRPCPKMFLSTEESQKRERIG